MRHLKVLGSRAYEGERSTTLVMLYVLSVRLRSVGTCPIKLADAIGVNKRTAQRFIYDSFNHSKLVSINLDLLTKILSFIGMSLTDLFTVVESFQKSRYTSVTYRIETNSFLFLTKSEFSKLSNDLHGLDNVVQRRKNLINKIGYQVLRPHLIEEDNYISQYPSSCFNFVNNRKRSPSNI